MLVEVYILLHDQAFFLVRIKFFRTYFGQVIFHLMITLTAKSHQPWCCARCP